MGQTGTNLLEMQETQVLSLGCRNPLKKGMATHSVFLPRQLTGQSLVGYHPGVAEWDVSEGLHSHFHFSSVRGNTDALACAWINSVFKMFFYGAKSKYWSLRKKYILIGMCIHFPLSAFTVPVQVSFIPNLNYWKAYWDQNSAFVLSSLITESPFFTFNSL